MPASYHLTSGALNNLSDIWDFIAADSVRAANRVESAILSACDSLGRRPSMGSRRTEITSLPVRFWAVSRFPNFVVVYRPDTKPMQVIAVLHGKRDIGTVLDEPGTL
jgi:antitoxin ParD1/3/4